MVRLVWIQTVLLLLLGVLYLQVGSSKEPEPTVKGFMPSIITVEELPPIRAENE